MTNDTTIAEGVRHPAPSDPTPSASALDRFAQRIAHLVAEGLRSELAELVADPSDYDRIVKLEQQVELQARTIGAQQRTNSTLREQLRLSNESHAHSFEAT